MREGSKGGGREGEGGNKEEQVRTRKGKEKEEQ